MLDPLKYLHLRPSDPLGEYILQPPSLPKNRKELISQLSSLITGDTYLRAVSLPLEKSQLDDFKILFRDFLQKIDPHKHFSLGELLNLSEELHEIMETVGIEDEYIPLKVIFDALGFGDLTFYLYDETVEEIMVNGRNSPVFVYKSGYGMLKTNIVLTSEPPAIRRMLKRSKESIVDISLENMRINIVKEPLSHEGTAITIRRHRKKLLNLFELVKNKTVSPELLSYLWLLIDGLEVAPVNFIVAGNTGGGKTTTLNALLTFVPIEERIIVIEDTREISIPHPNRVYLTTEGTDEHLMTLLVSSLRMRPDRIVVGEVRDREAVTLLAAMNVGHRASGTLHANSSYDVINRLTGPPMNVPEPLIKALNLIIVQHRIRTPRGTIRRVVEVAEVRPIGERINMGVVFTWDPSTDRIVRTDIPLSLLDKLSSETHIPKRKLLDELIEREEYLSKSLHSGKDPLETIISYRSEIL